MRIALVTGVDIPHDSATDDRPLQIELIRRGEDCEIVAWQTRSGWDRFDAVVLRSAWDYMAHYADFLRWAGHVSEVSRLFNPRPLIEWNGDKRYLAELQRHGARLAPTVWIEPDQPLDVAAEMEARGWRRGFLKPRIGTGASHTLRFDADDAGLQRAQAFLAARVSTAGFLLQPYLASIETHGEISAVVIDGRLSHGVRKVPAMGDYRVQDAWGASDAPHELDEAELRAVEAIVEAISRCAPGLGGEPPLYARIDLQWDDADELVLTEVELIEPSLFFRHDRRAPSRFADALLRQMGGRDQRQDRAI